MFDTKTHLQRLIAELERDIKENPDRRLSELATLKAALGAIAPDKPPTGNTVNVEHALAIAGHAMRAKVVIEDAILRGLREGSKKHQFRSTVDQLLKARIDQRVHRQDIIAKCRDMNMFGDTKDLDRDVSKYLSMDGTFAPDGDGYWKKKDQQALAGSH